MGPTTALVEKGNGNPYTAVSLNSLAPRAHSRTGTTADLGVERTKMRLRALDGMLDPGRRRRAKLAAAAFEDSESRMAAERVFFFLERVTGTKPSKIDLDMEVEALLRRGRSNAFWDRLDSKLSLDERRRMHVVENLRRGSVRHLIHHLCICRVCRVGLGGES
jgi:hypothetical protein